jgi:hypothetical protein
LSFIKATLSAILYWKSRAFFEPNNKSEKKTNEHLRLLRLQLKTAAILVDGGSSLDFRSVAVFRVLPLVYISESFL